MSTTFYSRDEVLQGRRAFSLSLASSGPFVVVTLLILLITAVPYAVAYRTTPAGWQFMGILMNVPDTSQYLSWARESSRSFFIENKLTSEHGAAVYFNLFFFIVGQIAAMFHIGYAEALQLMRVAAGAIYLGAIYWFTGLFFQLPHRRWTATLVASLGGGLGWVLVAQKFASGAADVAFPLDIYVSEANTFLSVLAFPLQAMAGGLVVLALGLAAIAFERRGFHAALVAGALVLLLGLQHGYDLLLVYSVVGITALLVMLRGGSRLRPLAIAACVCIWSLPTAIWSFSITHLDPIWRSTLAQYGNAGVYTPAPLHLLVLMGLPLILALAGVAASARRTSISRLGTWLRQASPVDVLLYVWFLIAFVLIYIPTDFQIKMFVSWQVPISIIATRTLFRALGALGSRRATFASRKAVFLAAGLLMVATIPTNAYLFGWRVLDLNRHEYPYFLRTDDVAALKWLDANTDRNAPVLSSLTIGQYLPSESGNSSFLGHWASTVDFHVKEYYVATFFNVSTPDSFRRALLKQFGIGFVFYGTPERAAGIYDPNRSTFLRKVFSNSSATIYQVVLSEDNITEFQ